jgi:hypothetical protein
MAMRDPEGDFITGIMRIVVAEMPTVNRDRLRRFEINLRAKFGGQRRYIATLAHAERKAARAKS